jgi:cytochrome c oxidase subunit 2
MTRRTAQGVLATLLLLAWHGLALAEMRLNLQDAKTQVGHHVHDLHTLVLIVCVVIFIGVFGVMFYAIWKHRKSAGHQAAHFHENTTVEVIWTVIPAFVLLGLMFPATKTLLAQRDTTAPDLTVKVTGYQWKWQYEYLDDGVSFYSNLSTPRAQIEGADTKGENYLLEVDKPMVVPVGKKVRVLTTAGDVIHAWYVPALAVKQDAIPGFVRDAWFKAEEPGVYRGQCAELCGKEHGFMPIVVEAVSEDKYKEWVAANKPAAPAAAAPAAAQAAPAGGAKAAAVDGKGTYDGLCGACHAAGLAGAPKTGDQGQWAPRLAQGQATLYEHAIKGIRAMPPKGGNPALSDEQVKAAVDYMVAQSK